MVKRSIFLDIKLKTKNNVKTKLFLIFVLLLISSVVVPDLFVTTANASDIKSEYNPKAMETQIDGLTLNPNRLLDSSTKTKTSPATDGIHNQIPGFQDVLINYDPRHGTVLSDITSMKDVELRRNYDTLNTIMVTVPTHLISIISNLEGVISIENDDILQPSSVPNDTYYTEIWAMDTIEAEFAWNITTGSSNVVVAVIDSGVELDHEDLANNKWVNQGEIAGNGIDDDSNGYIDDINGWDFYSNDASYFDDPIDDAHGTHVAGTIGGTGNNIIGVTGVNWDVSLMALKFLGPNGGTTSDAIAAIEYATTQGADIISASWGGGGYSDALKTAIDNCDCLFVAAAGNDALNNDGLPHYPSSYNSTNILSVASSIKAEELSPFSNYGCQSVDIVAPGSNIISTFPSGNPNGKYYSFSGTSMATPLVSGAAALLLANNPGMNALELKDRLMSTVDLHKSYENKVNSQGRLNLRRAMIGEINQENASINLQAIPSDRQISLNWDLPLSLTNETYILESAHPYTSDYNNTWTITRPGNDKIRIFFETIDVEDGWDYVYILDINDNIIETFTGLQTNFWTSFSDSDTIKIRLVSDSIITQYGFKTGKLGYGSPIQTNGIKVYRSEFYSAEYTLISQLPDGTTNFIDTTPKNKVKYYYKVETLLDTGNVNSSRIKATSDYIDIMQLKSNSYVDFVGDVFERKVYQTFTPTHNDIKNFTIQIFSFVSTQYRFTVCIDTNEDCINPLFSNTTALTTSGAFNITYTPVSPISVSPGNTYYLIIMDEEVNDDDAFIELYGSLEDEYLGGSFSQNSSLDIYFQINSSVGLDIFQSVVNQTIDAIGDLVEYNAYQTFTPIHPRIQGFSIMLEIASNGYYTFEVCITTSFQYNGECIAPLFSQSTTMTSTGGKWTFTYTLQNPIDVIPGNTYYIIIKDTIEDQNSLLVVYGSEVDSYEDGEFRSRPTQDMSFMMYYLDSQTPIVTAFPFFEYELGTSLQNIEFTITDETDEGTYQILRNDTLLSSGFWQNNTQLIWNVEGLSVGTYNYTIVASDRTGNAIFFTIMVIVSDTTPPLIDSPNDFTYEVGFTSNIVVWSGYDLEPGNYIVFHNNTEFTSGMWDGITPIEINIDGLSVGTHNITMQIFDMSGNAISDVVIIHIIDTTSPQVDSPEDMILGTNSGSISWIASDLDADIYQILENGTVVESGTWVNAETITYSFSSLELGTYNFTIVLFDGSRNSASDTVIVTIQEITVPTTTTTTTSPTGSTTSETETTSEPNNSLPSTTDDGGGNDEGFVAFNLLGFLLGLSGLLVIRRKRS